MTVGEDLHVDLADGGHTSFLSIDLFYTVTFYSEIQTYTDIHNLPVLPSLVAIYSVGIQPCVNCTHALYSTAHSATFANVMQTIPTMYVVHHDGVNNTWSIVHINWKCFDIGVFCYACCIAVWSFRTYNMYCLGLLA